jgi:hypothetical protein
MSSGSSSFLQLGSLFLHNKQPAKAAKVSE